MARMEGVGGRSQPTMSDNPAKTPGNSYTIDQLVTQSGKMVD